MAKSPDGAVESCATIEAQQGLTGKCGPSDAFEAKREFSAAPAPRREYRDHGWVYFIDDGEAIKIGFSVSPQHRLIALQTGHPRALKVIGRVSVKVIGENAIHRKFRHLRVRGEWFRPDPELLAFIEEVQRRPVPTPSFRRLRLQGVPKIKNPKQGRTALRRLSDDWPDNPAVGMRVFILCENLKCIERDPSSIARIAPSMNQTMAELACVLRNQGEYR